MVVGCGGGSVERNHGRNTLGRFHCMLALPESVPMHLCWDKLLARIDDGFGGRIHMTLTSLELFFVPGRHACGCAV
jgi:hypothetical protein